MADTARRKSPSMVSNEFAELDTCFSIIETHWGYAIQSNESPKSSLMVMQFTAMVSGAFFMSVALGLLVAVLAAAGTGDQLFRGVGAIIMASAAIYLLWFSARGSRTEWQIDSAVGEVREVVRNKTGDATVLGRYGFDAIGGVFLDRSFGDTDEAALVLRFGNTAQTMALASGPEARLEALRDRLGRDLIIERQNPRPLPVKPMRVVHRKANTAA